MPILPEPTEPIEFSEIVRHIKTGAEVTIRATFPHTAGREALDALDQTYERMRDQIEREATIWGGGD